MQNNWSYHQRFIPCVVVDEVWVAVREEGCLQGTKIECGVNLEKKERTLVCKDILKKNGHFLIDK